MVLAHGGGLHESPIESSQAAGHELGEIFAESGPQPQFQDFDLVANLPGTAAVALPATKIIAEAEVLPVVPAAAPAPQRLAGLGG